MAIQTNPHVGQVGLPIRMRFVDERGDWLDVSFASIRKILLRKPDGTVLDRDAVLVADTSETDGVQATIEYVTADGDLSVHGTWAMQGYIEGTLSGVLRKWPSFVERFVVDRNVGPPLLGLPAA